MVYRHGTRLAAALAALIVVGGGRIAIAADNGGGAKMLPSEAGQGDAKDRVAAAHSAGAEGVTLDGFYPATIVRLNDGSLMTEKGLRSNDGGRSWNRPPGSRPTPGNRGLLRLPNGELGCVEGRWDMPEALGNKSNNWFFRWSANEGETWSKPVQITIPGATMGLDGTAFASRDGRRIFLVTYSQFLGSQFDNRGISWGTYKGVRLAIETEGHFPLNEVCRVYYSDDNGRSWTACDGWIMAWRDQRWSDAFTEGVGIELKDGRIMVVGRAITGRLYQAASNDRGRSWPAAQPMELASSYSPARMCRLPKTGDILLVWNQVSRAEIRRGLRRCRLSCAVSRDEGKTWGYFKNLEAIASLAGIAHVPPDPDFSPVVGDDEVGPVPDDFAIFHYPNLNVVGDEVFVSYMTGSVRLDKDKDGNPVVANASGVRTRILPVDWFYK